MALPDLTASHFLQHLFADIHIRSNRPLLSEKQGTVIRTLKWRDAISLLSSLVRSLTEIGLGAGDRIALHAKPSSSLLISEWAALAARGVVVIIPQNFPGPTLIETLVESKSKLVIVGTLSAALHLTQNAEKLPDLKHIVCFEGGMVANLPIWSWDDFMELGRTQPDRMASTLRAITPKDTAMLFFYKDEHNVLQASRYTHESILQHIARMESVIGDASAHENELVMSATFWENPIGHIASYYAPTLKEASILIMQGTLDIALFENAPQILIGDAQFFNNLRNHIMLLIRQSADIESAMLTKAVSLGKTRYESDKNPRPLPRLLWAALQATIVKKVKRMLGGKLRLLVGADNETHYETQIFFHTFGIELVELPQELFK